MNWKRAFSTAIGKKLIMGATGLFLILFLVVHAYVNAQIFWNDGGQKFNEAAAFMGGNPVIRAMEIGLFAFLIWHAVLGLQLYFRNRGKRTTRYAVSPGNKTSSWYSRSMAILGTLILLFLILHLRNFWVPSRFTGLEEYDFNGVTYHDLFGEMVEHFDNILIVAVYVLGCFSLAWHLVHGFFSAFQTFGLTMHRYKGAIYNIGVAFSILIPLVFAAMPVWIYLGVHGYVPFQH